MRWYQVGSHVYKWWLSWPSLTWDTSFQCNRNLYLQNPPVSLKQKPAPTTKRRLQQILPTAWSIVACLLGWMIPPSIYQVGIAGLATTGINWLERVQPYTHKQPLHRHLAARGWCSFVRISTSKVLYKLSLKEKHTSPKCQSAWDFCWIIFIHERHVTLHWANLPNPRLESQLEIFCWEYCRVLMDLLYSLRIVCFKKT